jgi:hypothetical protein
LAGVPGAEKPGIQVTVSILAEAAPEARQRKHTVTVTTSQVHRRVFKSFSSL